MTATQTLGSTLTMPANDPQYDALLADMTRGFAARVGDRLLFTTEAGDLWARYLDALPPGDRQTYTCRACQAFVERYGGLVTINLDGSTTSPFWTTDWAPVAALRTAVERAPVTGVFLTAERQWGRPVTRASSAGAYRSLAEIVKDGPLTEWHHMAVDPPAGLVFVHAVQTADQRAAERRQDFLQVERALREYNDTLVARAVEILKTDALYRAEKVLGPVQWLHDLHVARALASDKRRARNVLWRAIALAPAGFCHPRSGMAGTLLDDLASGMDFTQAARRFRDKTSPEVYQRPVAAPAAATIAQAEKVIGQLKAAGSLARRYCRLDEVQAVWRPQAPTAPARPAGVFGSVRARDAEPAAPDIRLPPQTITWDKLWRTVLPDAQRIQYRVAGGRLPLAALVTAVQPDAPPILQWDQPDARNPVSWYVWQNGSPAGTFDLQVGRLVDVVAVALKPSQWSGVDRYPHHGRGVLFLLDGARDITQPAAGAGLFPEIMRSEFHGIRSVIEAYSRQNPPAAVDKPACGLLLAGSNDSWDHTFDVTARGTTIPYRVDRWD